MCSGRRAPNSSTSVQSNSEQNLNVQMKAGVFSESLIPTYYQAIRCYYPEFCNLNSDRGKMSNSLSFFVGGPVFYGTGTECVINYNKCACRTILMLCILINIKVMRYVKQHVSMCRKFSISVSLLQGSPISFKTGQYSHPNTYSHQFYRHVLQFCTATANWCHGWRPSILTKLYHGFRQSVWVNTRLVASSTYLIGHN